jgi:hypothetical protein
MSCLPACPPVHHPTCLPPYFPACLPACPYACQSVDVSVCLLLSIGPWRSAYTFVCPPVYLYIVLLLAFHHHLAVIIYQPLMTAEWQGSVSKSASLT